VGDGLSDVALKVAGGIEGLDEDLAVLVIDLLLGASEDAELAGESVARRQRALPSWSLGGPWNGWDACHRNPSLVIPSICNL
jgi:hypothetical protein